MGKETYLYLTGLEVTQEIPLASNKVLLPVKLKFPLEKVLKLLKDDVDFAIAILNSKSILSQLKIIADGSESLAKTTWNAQWDAFLLSAIFNCQSIANIQCTCPIEEITDDTYIQITNYHLRGVLTPPYMITQENSNWLSQYFKNALSLLSYESFETAIHSMATYKWHSVPRIQLAILWAGIESLFNISSELVFRISLYAANFLTDRKDEARSIFKEVNDLYKARSSAVHGGKIKGDAIVLVEKSAGLLNKLILKCIEINGLPVVQELVL